MSQIVYGIELYGPAATKYQIELLQSFQNRLVKWICQSPVPTSIELERKSCGMLTIFQTIVLRVLSLGLTVLMTKKPHNLYNSLMRREEQTVSRNRQLRNLVSVASGQYYQSRSWKNFFLKYFHQLPKDLRSIMPRKKKGKKQLKKWVLTEIPKHPP